MDSPWLTPSKARWARLMVESWNHWLGPHGWPPLVSDDEERGSERDRWLAHQLFELPAAVLSHEGGADPVFVWGSRRALQVFERSWDELMALPSRLSAEADLREERQRMLASAAAHGFFAGYRGVRISASGRRFVIEDAVVWVVRDESENPVGQAAWFASTSPV